MDLILQNSPNTTTDNFSQRHRAFFLIAGKGPAIKMELIAARMNCTAGAECFQKIALSAIF